MTRYRIASAAALLLLALAVLAAPGAGAQTPSPSPSGSASAAPSPSGATASPKADPERESLALLLSAEPATIEVGGETLLVAQVTNTGNVAVDAELVVELPGELELVDAFPAPSSAGATHTFALGPVEPGDSAVAQITARGTNVVPEAVVDATATGGSARASDSTGVSVVVTGGAAGLEVTSRAGEVLAQVGSTVRYVVTVTNEGSEDLEDVLVVDLAPEEIEVVSVGIVDEVEAVQIGESLGRYDVVWNVGELPAGASLDLPWEGRAVRPGDLVAANSVRGLIGPTETVRSTSRSFLAAEGRRDVANPRFEPIEKRVVTFVDPPPRPAPRAATETQPGTVLPFTGSEMPRLVLSGILFVLAGALVLGGARLAPPGSGKAVAAAAVAAVVLVACVAGDEGGDATPRTFGTDDPRSTGEPQVKGERIVRGDEDEDATPAPSRAPEATARPTPAPTETPAPASPPATATPPPVVAAPATTAPVEDPEPIRVVEIVRTELEDLPVETLGSRAGDNTIAFSWDESAGIVGASSGTRFVRGSGSELFTDLTEGDGSIVNEMTLRNTHEAVRLAVRGRLVHEVFSGGRLVARLRSAPIDLVLAPGGSVSARFAYLVPGGDYAVESAFEASH